MRIKHTPNSQQETVNYQINYYDMSIRDEIMQELRGRESLRESLRDFDNFDEDCYSLDDILKAEVLADKGDTAEKLMYLSMFKDNLI